MSPRTTLTALNLKAWKSTEPVFTKKLGENSCTVTSTVVPFWVSVTSPNGGVPQPPVQWSLVNWKVIARAGPAPNSKSAAARTRESRRIRVPSPSTRALGSSCSLCLLVICILDGLGQLDHARGAERREEVPVVHVRKEPSTRRRAMGRTPEVG